MSMESQFPNDDGKGMLCRQSSTRWTPTTEQIRILKDLYYNNGVRSPNADQIQKISAKLRQYGKIEGKNVFYWFQNHKARERQKKKLTTDHHHHHHLLPMQRSNLWKSTDESSLYPCNKYPNNNITSVVAPSSSAGLVGNYGAYGSLAMEKTFRQDCTLSSAGFNGGNGQICNSFMNVSPQYKRSGGYGDEEQYYNYYQQEEHHQQVQEIETLPLFPMHGDEDGCFNKQQQQQQYYPTNWYQYPMNGCSRASLELTLNSYGNN